MTVSRRPIRTWIAAAALVGLWSGARPAGGETPRPAVAPAGAGGELWIGPPSVYGNGVWFPDETTPLAEEVARLLARPELGGYRVVPVKRVRALFDDVQAGRLPGVATVCSAPPPPSWLARLVYRGASTAEVRVDCPPPGKKASPSGAGCRLEVIVSSPRPTAEDPTKFDETARFAAPLPKGESPSRWAERLRARGLTRARAPETTGGLGLSGFLSDGKKQPPISVEVDDVTLSGRWPSRISAATFAEQAAALDACTKPGAVWRDSFQQPYLIEVDPTGQVDRCEFAYVDHLPKPEFACVCGVLRGMRFAPGVAARRASFDLQVSRSNPAARDPFQWIAYLSVEHASDPSATLGTGAVGGRELAACFSPLGKEIGKMVVPVRLSIAADGQVASHESKWPAVIPGGVGRCLDGVLAQGRFNCPLSGAAAIDARLHVQAFRAGSR